MADVKMTQEAVIRQVLSKMPEQGNQINIIMTMIGQMNSGDIPQEMVKVSGLRDAVEEFDLLKLFESLPHPRMSHLISKIIALITEKFPTRHEAAKFLGMSETSVYRHREIDTALDEFYAQKSLPETR